MKPFRFVARLSAALLLAGPVVGQEMSRSENAAKTLDAAAKNKAVGKSTEKKGHQHHE